MLTIQMMLMLLIGGISATPTTFAPRLETIDGMMPMDGAYPPQFPMTQILPPPAIECMPGSVSDPFACTRPVDTPIYLVQHYADGYRTWGYPMYPGGPLPLLYQGRYQVGYPAYSMMPYPQVQYPPQITSASPPQHLSNYQHHPPHTSVSVRQSSQPSHRHRNPRYKLRKAADHNRLRNDDIKQSAPIPPVVGNVGQEQNLPDEVPQPLSKDSVPLLDAKEPSVDNSAVSFPGEGFEDEESLAKTGNPASPLSLPDQVDAQAFENSHMQSAKTDVDEWELVPRYALVPHNEWTTIPGTPRNFGLSNAADETIGKESDSDAATSGIQQERVIARTRSTKKKSKSKGKGKGNPKLGGNVKSDDMDALEQELQQRKREENAIHEVYALNLLAFEESIEVFGMSLPANIEDLEKYQVEYVNALNSGESNDMLYVRLLAAKFSQVNLNWLDLLKDTFEIYNERLALLNKNKVSVGEEFSRLYLSNNAYLPLSAEQVNSDVAKLRDILSERLQMMARYERFVTFLSNNSTLCSSLRDVNAPFPTILRDEQFDDFQLLAANTIELERAYAELGFALTPSGHETSQLQDWIARVAIDKFMSDMAEEKIEINSLYGDRPIHVKFALRMKLPVSDELALLNYALAAVLHYEQMCNDGIPRLLRLAAKKKETANNARKALEKLKTFKGKPKKKESSKKNAADAEADYERSKQMANTVLLHVGRFLDKAIPRGIDKVLDDSLDYIFTNYHQLLAEFQIDFQ